VRTVVEQAVVVAAAGRGVGVENLPPHSSGSFNELDPGDGNSAHTAATRVQANCTLVASAAERSRLAGAQASSPQPTAGSVERVSALAQAHLLALLDGALGDRHEAAVLGQAHLDVCRAVVVAIVQSVLESAPWR